MRCRCSLISTCVLLTRYGTAESPDGSKLYATSHLGRRVYVADLETFVVKTLAGSGTSGFADGLGTNALFSSLGNCVVSPNSGTVFVADRDNHRVRAVDAVTQAVTTVAGTGTKSSNDGFLGEGTLSGPFGVAVSSEGTVLFITEYWGQVLRKLNLATSEITTIYTSSSPLFGVCISLDSSMAYMTEWDLNKVVSFNTVTEEVTTILNIKAIGIAISSDGGTIAVHDDDIGAMKLYNIATASVTTMKHNERARVAPLP